jgi:hypothetical protein
MGHQGDKRIIKQKGWWRELKSARDAFAAPSYFSADFAPARKHLIHNCGSEILGVGAAPDQNLTPPRHRATTPSRKSAVKPGNFVNS